jgi:hypothetical protein
MKGGRVWESRTEKEQNSRDSSMTTFQAKPTEQRMAVGRFGIDTAIVRVVSSRSNLAESMSRSVASGCDSDGGTL